AEESSNYVVGSELILDAWKACSSAYSCKDFYENEFKKNILIVAFCGSQKSTDYVTETDFDECQINNDNQYFQSMNDGNIDDPKPALVRKSFLDRFLCMLQRSNLKDKVLQAQNEKKTVIFTGHSFGGVIASLWTLWALEKCHENFPLCITFGCPLLGDKIFAKAIEREQWSPYFCHIVSRHDIVPRICFSPFKSPAISKALEQLLPYWYKSMTQQAVQDGSHPLSKDVSLSFIKRVIGDASQVVTCETGALVVGAANLVGGAVKDLIKSSPYRPFGYYVFCSTTSTACCIENTDATLQMLYFALENNRLSGACIMEHLEYEKIIEQISKSSGLMAYYSKIAKFDKSSTDEVRMALQLEAMGIGIQNHQAWLGLKAAEDKKNKLTKNMDQQITKLDEMQNCMAKLEWYKTSCEEDGFSDYYNCFKTHKTEKELKANKNRFKLAAFWDGITELVEKEELPKDLQTQEKWVNAGTEYRLLVEPLDIARYYRLGKHEELGHYLVHGRPKRYRLLQKWLEDKERKGGMESRKRTEPAQDSCFWASVEEGKYPVKTPHSSNDEELRGSGE
ncbi:hypothetical protein KI387_022335, partial [Taxus chinensis]